MTEERDDSEVKPPLMEATLNDGDATCQIKVEYAPGSQQCEYTVVITGTAITPSDTETSVLMIARRAAIMIRETAFTSVKLAPKVGRNKRARAITGAAFIETLYVAFGIDDTGIVACRQRLQKASGISDRTISRCQSGEGDLRRSTVERVIEELKKRNVDEALLSGVTTAYTTWMNS